MTEPANTAPHRNTLKLVAALFGSTVTAQLAALLATAFAALHTQPAEFATYAAIFATTSVLASVSALATETRVAVVGSDTAKVLTRSGLASSALVGLCVLTIAVVAQAAGHRWASAALGIALGVVLVASHGLLTALAVRHDRQELLARGRIVQGLVNAFLILLLISLPIPGSLVLTGAWLSSSALSSATVAYGLRGQRIWAGLPRKGDLKIVGGQVGIQPLNNLVTNTVTALPAIVLPLLGAVTVAGAWALVSRVLNAVVNTVFSAVSPVYNGQVAGSLRGGAQADASAIHTRWLKRLLWLIPVMVCGTVVGTTWILPLLGEQWLAARSVTWPAALAFTALAVWLPLSQTLVMLGRTDLEFRWGLTTVLLGAGSLGLVPAVGGSVALLVWAVVLTSAIVLHLALQRKAARPGR